MLVQVELDVPKEIYKGVCDGTLSLMGLAKDSKSRVRKHIPKAKIAKVDEVAKRTTGSILQVLKENKVVAISVAVGTAVLGAGVYAIHSIKERKKELAEERIEGFQKALKDYLAASKKGKLNAKVVNKLLAELEELENNRFGKDIELTIPTSQLTALIFSIFSYTQMLANANSYEVNIDKPKKGTKGNIVSLKSYLEIQKQILEKTA